MIRIPMIRMVMQSECIGTRVPELSRGNIDYYLLTRRVHLLDNYSLVGYSAKTYEIPERNHL